MSENDPIVQLAKNIADDLRDFMLGRDGSFYAIEPRIERMLRRHVDALDPPVVIEIPSDAVQTCPTCAGSFVDGDGLCGTCDGLGVIAADDLTPDNFDNGHDPEPSE